MHRIQKFNISSKVLIGTTLLTVYGLTGQVEAAGRASSRAASELAVFPQNAMVKYGPPQGAMVKYQPQLPAVIEDQQSNVVSNRPTHLFPNVVQRRIQEMKQVKKGSREFAKFQKHSAGVTHPTSLPVMQYWHNRSGTFKNPKLNELTKESAKPVLARNLKQDTDNFREIHGFLRGTATKFPNFKNFNELEKIMLDKGYSTERGSASIQSGDIVEGSKDHGGVLGHTFMDFDNPLIQPLMDFAKNLKSNTELTTEQKMEEIVSFVYSNVLKKAAYDCHFLKMAQLAGLESKVENLSVAVLSGVGDCRVHAFLTAGAALEAGIDAKIANYVVRHRIADLSGVWEVEKLENHTMVVYEGSDGLDRIADSYFSHLDGHTLKSLMKGYVGQHEEILFVRANDFPRILKNNQRVFHQ